MSGDSFQAFIDAAMAAIRVLLELDLAMSCHEDLWGVPVGPTLSMVHPPKLVGLAGLMSGLYDHALTGDTVWSRPVDTTPTELDIGAILRRMGPVDGR